MRYAIVSDIHANLEALTAVLEDIEKRGVEQVLCLGDIVGYGPNPRECLKKVYQRIRAMPPEMVRVQTLGRSANPKEPIRPIVRGNHEDGVMDSQYAKEEFTPHAYESITWTREILRGEFQLNELPYAMEVRTSSRRLLLAHGDWTVPAAFEYFEPNKNGVREALLKHNNFREMPEQSVLFVGHTHKPALLTDEHRRWIQPGIGEESRYELNMFPKAIVNVGSIGQPRRLGDRYATYVVYDEEADTVTFHPVEYDSTQTIAAIQQLPLSGKTIEKLARFFPLF